MLHRSVFFCPKLKFCRNRSVLVIVCYAKHRIQNLGKLKYLHSFQYFAIKILAKLGTISRNILKMCACIKTFLTFSSISFILYILEYLIRPNYVREKTVTHRNCCFSYSSSVRKRSVIY